MLDLFNTLSTFAIAQFTLSHSYSFDYSTVFTICHFFENCVDRILSTIRIFKLFIFIDLREFQHTCIVHVDNTYRELSNLHVHKLYLTKSLCFVESLKLRYSQHCGSIVKKYHDKMSFFLGWSVINAPNIIHGLCGYVVLSKYI